MHDLVYHPLVIVITGPTGSGKSETAISIANALLTNRIKRDSGESNANYPEGFIKLDGADYIDRSNITSLQEHIRDDIARDLYKCLGHVVILFDEVQKAAREALAVFSSLLQGTSAYLKHPEAAQPLDATRTVIILISDIAIDEIEKYMETQAINIAKIRLKSPSLLPTVEEITTLNRIQTTFATEMRKRLKTDFHPSEDAVGLELGNLADNIISFMPLNYSGVIDVLDKGLTEISKQSSVRTFAHELRWDKEVLGFLATPKFAKYKIDSSLGSKDSKNLCREDFSRVVKLQKEQQNLRKEIETNASHDTDGTRISSDTRTKVKEYQVGINALFTEEIQICKKLCGMPRSCILEFGGREILRHSDSPIQKLLKVLRKYLPRYPTLKDIETAAKEGSHKYINTCTKSEILNNQCKHSSVSSSPDSKEPYEVLVSLDLRINCDQSIKELVCNENRGLEGMQLEIVRCIQENSFTPDRPVNKVCHVLYTGTFNGNLSQEDRLPNPGTSRELSEEL